MKEYSFHVSDLFLCALLYGDAGELDTADVDDLVEFNRKLPHVGKWLHEDHYDKHVGTCDITGLKGLVVKVTYFSPH